MGRRSNQGRGAAKVKLRGSAAAKRRHAPTRFGRGPSAVRRAREIARLTREFNEVMEQQQATAEMLRLINVSSGDLQPVFANILASAVRICEADSGAIHSWDGVALRLIATHNLPAAYVEMRQRTLHRPHKFSASGRLLASKKAVHIPDLAADEAYLSGNPSTVAAVELAGVRTTLAVPMWKEDQLIGSFTVGRGEVRPFSEKQIAIVENFAAQAVIALDNARLVKELRERTDRLRHSATELRRERNNKLMNLEAMAASIAHEVRQPLASIASNGGAALRFLARTPPNLDEVHSAVRRMVRDSYRASEVFDNIRALFGKPGLEREQIDMNELLLGVLQALSEELASRHVRTETVLASPLPPVAGHRGQLQEVFINLVRNATEAMDAVGDDRRLLKVRAERHEDGAVAVLVEDSGPGIDPKQSDRIFEAFVTTKPGGTGLGLALCRMIIERHEGRLSMTPAHPHGCVFRAVLPAGSSR
jgi:signal transduction histidine kinase